MKRIIVTADDYGVVPSIDRGVIKGVIERKINSVAAFANYGEAGETSVANVKQLIVQSADHDATPEIGVHLTISSGSPILGRDAVPSLCRTDADLEGENPLEANHFNAHTELSRDAINVNELRAELQAQIDVFKSNDIPIAHLTCHHHTLIFFERFFKVYMDLAADNNIPIRSSRVEPKLKNDLYLKLYMYFMLWDDTDLDEADELATFLKKIEKVQAEYRKGEVSSPSFLETSHYGPLPMHKLKAKKMKKFLRKKRKAMGKMIERFKEGDDTLMEIVLHVREGDISSNTDYKQEVIDARYAGIDHRYFDSRVVELNSILETDWDQIFAENDMGWGIWGEA